MELPQLFKTDNYDEKYCQIRYKIKVIGYKQG